MRKIAVLLLMLLILSSCGAGVPNVTEGITAPSITEPADTATADTTEAPVTEYNDDVKPEYTGTHYTYGDIVRRMLDTSFLAREGNGERSAEFTSYDRASKLQGNAYVDWKANGDGGKYIGTTSDGGFLIAEMEGPGYISRIWSATAGTGHVKIYVDGAETPVIDLPFEKFFNCTAEPFSYKGLVYNDAAQGKNCYVPITYNKSCRVVAYGDWGKYYHINYTTLNPLDTVESLTSAALSSDQKKALNEVNSFYLSKLGTDPQGNVDGAFSKYCVTPDAPAVIELKGRGAVSGILVRVDSVPEFEHPSSKGNVELLKTLRVRIYWDGEEEPSVNVPLGDFFGSSYGFTAARTLLLGVRDDRTLYNYYYMPYYEGARIEISSDSLCADISVAVTVAENTVPRYAALQFSAIYSLGEYANPATRWPDHHIFDAEGSGRLVGLNLHVSMLQNGPDPASSPGNPWWGEGDEKFFVDGESFPSWYGTGTEDFFGYAWCDPTLFNKALHCQSYCVGRSLLKGNRVVTRLLMADSIPFEKSFEAYLEKYYGDDYVNYGYTAFLYLANDADTDAKPLPSEEILARISLDTSAYIKDVTEGEDLYVIKVDGKGSAVTQAMTSFGDYWSNTSQLFCKSLAVGQGVTAVLPAEEDGDYMLVASFTSAPDYGIISVDVNGNAVGGNIDLYATSVRADMLTEIGRVTLKKGYNNTVTFTVRGKNTKATNTLFGIDFLMLVPADEYDGLSSVTTDWLGVYRANSKPSLVTGSLMQGEKMYSAVSSGKKSTQLMTSFSGTWSRNAQLWWTGTKVGDTLTLRVHVMKGGEYDVSMAITKAKDYGIFSIAVNGKTVKTVDGYNASVVRSVISLGRLELKAGDNTIVLRITGKNANATNYMVGIDTVKVDYKGE